MRTGKICVDFGQEVTNVPRIQTGCWRIAVCPAMRATTYRGLLMRESLGRRSPHQILRPQPLKLKSHPAPHVPQRHQIAKIPMCCVDIGLLMGNVKTIHSGCHRIVQCPATLVICEQPFKMARGQPGARPRSPLVIK